MKYQNIENLQPGQHIRLLNSKGRFVYHSVTRAGDKAVLSLTDESGVNCECHCKVVGRMRALQVDKLVFEDGRIETFSNYEG